MDTSGITGCGTALITPFHADGAVDENALQALVRWQVQSGIRLLVACGSTGEASTLTEEETLTVARLTIAAAEGKAQVFVGCTHNSTAEAVRRASRIAQLPGLSGILTACPYYNRPSQEGMYLHFKAIAEAIAPLPILLYNVPGRTASNLEPATVLRLSEIPNIVGIKESSGNLVQIAEIINLVPRTFRVFSGDDAFALPTISAGAIGLISVASNVAPALMCQMVTAALAHDWPSARVIHKQTSHLVRDLFSEPSPGPVKAILAAMGRIEGDTLRLPMTPVTLAGRSRIEATAAELGLLTPAPTL
jgi:4-hydroxy-tetrahydrodipicolinate synthase